MVFERRRYWLFLSLDLSFINGALRRRNYQFRPADLGRFQLNEYQSKLTSIDHWMRGHLPECAIFTMGVFLRLTMVAGWRFQTEWGFDWSAHWKYVEYILQHASLPRIEEVSAAYHPPLYYLIAAGLTKLGASMSGVAWLSFACGVLRLALILLGLEWYLQNRRARLAALSLAAVFPTSVHIDGILGNEAMNCLVATVAMLLLVRAFQSERQRRSVVLGLALGLAALSKPSAMALLAAFGVGVMLELLALLKPIDWRFRLKLLLPRVATVIICLAVCGWFYARNVKLYHDPLATNYEVMPEWTGHVANINTPFLDRRPLGFVFGWDWSVYRMPYYPVGLEGQGRFFPVVLTSTYVDYYNVNFSGLHDGQGDLIVNWRPVTTRLLWLSRGAMTGGSVILLGTLVAWAVCMWRTFQRRDWGLFALLLVPLIAVLAALSFAIKYPYNTHGVIKGIYLQFSAPPLYALFGLSVAWATAQRRRWHILAVLLLGLGAVAAYTVCCRTGLFM